MSNYISFDASYRKEYDVGNVNVVSSFIVESKVIEKVVKLLFLVFSPLGANSYLIRASCVDSALYPLGFDRSILVYGLILGPKLSVRL